MLSYRGNFSLENVPKEKSSKIENIPSPRRVFKNICY